MRSVKQLQITIHFGGLSWALSKCSKLGRTCLLLSVTITYPYTPSEFMNSVVVHYFSCTWEQYIIMHSFLLRFTFFCIWFPQLI